MTVQLTSVNPKYSNIFNFVKKSDLVKGGSATFRNEGGPSFNLSTISFTIGKTFLSDIYPSEGTDVSI